MAASIRQFKVELYREHLDEASFLYDQRLAYLYDPEVKWPALREWEERFEAHIDALVLGCDLAQEVCRQRATEGDAGELHSALCVLCRHDRRDDAFALLDAVDPANEAQVRAVSQALSREMPTEWRDHLLVEFERDQRLTPVFAHVIGYRRLPAEDLLQKKLEQAPAVGRTELAWAMGRVGTAESVPLLWILLSDQDERTCEAAAIALMRLGDDQILHHAMTAVQNHVWAQRVLAIGGGRDSVGAVLDVLASPRASPETVLAAGLLGDLAAVAPLLGLLDSELSEAAAVALNTITGAQLHAPVFVPDTFDVDELDQEEREAFEKDGTCPARLGERYGNWERRPLLDRRGWRDWLDQNRNRFDREHRWRMGKPHGPAALFECLSSETSPYAVRAATSEELVIRFGLDVPFEVDLLVDQQRSFLKKIEDWAARQSGTLSTGGWYFAGEIQR